MFYLSAAATDSHTTTIPAWLAVAVPTVLAILAAIILFSIYRNKVDRLEKDVEKYERKIDQLRTDTDQLLEFKTQAQKFIDKSIYNDKSPLTLTDFGKTLVNDSGFKDIFEVEKDNLVRMLESQNPTTQYEVQEKARFLMDSLSAYAPFKPIQDYAFKTGKDFNQILRAGAILLRDYYFKIHPELVNPSEKY